MAKVSWGGPRIRQRNQSRVARKAHTRCDFFFPVLAIPSNSLATATLGPSCRGLAHRRREPLPESPSSPRESGPGRDHHRERPNAGSGAEHVAVSAPARARERLGLLASLGNPLAGRPHSGRRPGDPPPAARRPGARGPGPAAIPCRPPARRTFGPRSARWLSGFLAGSEQARYRGGRLPPRPRPASGPREPPDWPA